MIYRFELFFLFFSLLFLSYSSSQTQTLNIEQNAKLDSLLELKIKWDRENFENSYYTIQILYGSLQNAEDIEIRFKKIFPNIPTNLSFETPNYKVQSGRYKNKLYAQKTLDSIKPYFPSAFLLKRKKSL